MANNNGEDLMTYRIRQGMTLREMAHKTGLSPATLHRLERGTIAASPRSRVLLQDRLKLSSERVDGLLEASQSSNRREKWESITLRAKEEAHA